VNGAGWTLYAPLSVSGSVASFQGRLLVLFALIVIGYSSTLTSANFLATTLIRKRVGL
jgi:heme/copper-type cytochrome/quinol oxidase subunit 1